MRFDRTFALPFLQVTRKRIEIIGFNRVVFLFFLGIGRKTPSRTIVADTLYNGNNSNKECEHFFFFLSYLFILSVYCDPVRRNHQNIITIRLAVIEV